MEFNYKYNFNHLSTPIKYSHQLFAIGSCFAENIGKLLSDHKFPTTLNPSGILFNPISIANNIECYLHPDLFNENENIFQHQGLYHSWMHHGSFSSDNESSLKVSIQQKLNLANQKLLAANYLLITWGSAYVYEIKESQKIVANCHKVPNTHFHKRLLSVNEIVNHYNKLLRQLLSVNPNLRVIWSISPVKYLKDGLHQNNLSKSTLLLALDQLLNEFPHQYYFPAYELVQDELRDYRFYAEDFAHPNNLAIKYIWEKFITSCLEDNAQDTLLKIAALNQAMMHKPLQPKTSSYQIFRQQQQIKTQALQQEFPHLNFEKELAFFK